MQDHSKGYLNTGKLAMPRSEFQIGTGRPNRLQNDLEQVGMEPVKLGWGKQDSGSILGSGADKKEGIN